MLLKKPNKGELICIDNGIIAFLGYKRKFSVGYLQSKCTTPLHDEVVKLFIEPSNLIPISLIKGNTVGNAYRKSQEAMWRNFQFMLSTKATQEQKSSAPYLWMNMKSQVALGNLNAKG